MVCLNDFGVVDLYLFIIRFLYFLMIFIFKSFGIFCFCVFFIIRMFFFFKCKFIGWMQIFVLMYLIYGIFKLFVVCNFKWYFCIIGILYRYLLQKDLVIVLIMELVFKIYLIVILLMLIVIVGQFLINEFFICRLFFIVWFVMIGFFCLNFWIGLDSFF